MKNLLSLALTLGFTISANAQITFLTGTWAETKAIAKKENKMIFIDAYTTWCGPCKMLAANVFTDKGVGEYHNANFINYKMDMEKGEGVDFAQEFRINAYPTLLYFTKEGEIAHRTVGAPQIAQLLEISKNALDPDKQFYTLLKKFKAGERNADFLRKLSDAGESASADEMSDIASEVSKTWKAEDWEKPENAKTILMGASKGFDTELFQYVAKNKSKFSDNDLLSILDPILNVEVPKVVSLKDENAMKALQEKIIKYFPAAAPQVNPSIAKYFYEKTGNTKKAEATIEETLKGSKDWSQLNEAAWSYYEKETDTAKLQKALDWAKRSVELEENFYNTDTYAHLFHKLGNKKEALKWAKKAIELGKKAGEDTKGTEELINEIKNKK